MRLFRRIAFITSSDAFRNFSSIGYFFSGLRMPVATKPGQIAAQPRKTSIFHTFPLRGWILIIFMLCLGISMKFIPGLPPKFTASFYCGLGPMLLFASGRFVYNSVKQCV